MTDNADWLAGLQEGDEVVVRSATPWRTKRRERIKRFTKLLIVTVDEFRFRRSDGRSPGQEWPLRWIEQPTPAQARKAKR